MAVARPAFSVDATGLEVLLAFGVGVEISAGVLVGFGVLVWVFVAVGAIVL